jgi:hypothetical protein
MRQITIENTEVFSLEEIKIGKELQKSMKDIPVNELIDLKQRMDNFQNCLTELQKLSYYRMAKRIDSLEAFRIAQDITEESKFIVNKIAIEQLIQDKLKQDVINAL